MAQREEIYEAALASVLALEQTLRQVEEQTKEISKNEEILQERIEEYFSKCVDALAAKKLSLLRDVEQKTKQLEAFAKQAQYEIEKTIGAQKEMIKSGLSIAVFAPHNAEVIWKGVTCMIPPLFEARFLGVKLSEFLVANIRSCGEVHILPLTQQHIEITQQIEIIHLQDKPQKFPEIENAEGHALQHAEAPQRMRVSQHAEMPKRSATPQHAEAQAQRVEEHAFVDKRAHTSRGTEKIPQHVSTVQRTNFMAIESVTTFLKGQNLKSLSGICCMDAQDGFYVIDDTTVKNITLAGKISTVAQGLVLSCGIAAHSASGCLYVADRIKHQIMKIHLNGKLSVLTGGEEGQEDGNSARASFNRPYGVTVDQHSGNIFVCEIGNHSIRKISPQGDVTTIVGYECGSSQNVELRSPQGIYFDHQTKSLLVCDTCNDKLREISMQGEVTTLCEIPRPSDVLIINNNILVNACTEGWFWMTRQGKGVVKLTHPALTSWSRFTYHQASNSCYAVTGNAILRIKFKDE